MTTHRDCISCGEPTTTTVLTDAGDEPICLRCRYPEGNDPTD